MSWFEVDKEGLAKLVERRGKVFILHELLQNAWDCADVTSVQVMLIPIEGKPYAKLSVVDDHPDGFRDLSHAYTLFAESEKKAKADKRGRFNLGEKLVLSLCEEAVITSTTGTVTFTKDGGRRERRGRARISGTAFSATVRMTRAELDEVLAEVKKVVPPPGTKTFINDEQILARKGVKNFSAVLKTELADERGVVSRRYRETLVTLYNIRQNERATLYEMGIPVMELGDDPFHVDVGQKIPMGMERDAVTAAWLKELRGTVLDHTHELLSETSARGRWIGDAIEEANQPEAVRNVITKRFGSKAVIADPSDREGENIAKARGYTVIPGGSFTAEAWEKIRQTSAALPAGQVTPSPKPFHPDGQPLHLVPPDEWTPLMRNFADFAEWFGYSAAHLSVGIQFTRDRDWAFGAAYSKGSSVLNAAFTDVQKHPGASVVGFGRIIFNLSRLGLEFLEDREAQVRLLIHEMGHHFGHHLEEPYHEALCRIGARIAIISLTESERFLPPDIR